MHALHTMKSVLILLIKETEKIFLMFETDSLICIYPLFPKTQEVIKSQTCPNFDSDTCCHLDVSGLRTM